MGGSPEWDNRMMDTLKNFDLNSPDVKEQFGELYMMVILAEFLTSLIKLVFIYLQSRVLNCCLGTCFFQRL